MMCHCKCTNSSNDKRIDWVESRNSNAIELLTAEIQARLRPLLEGVREYDSPEMISREIGQVAELLTKTAEEFLPSVKSRRKSRFRDDTLSCLCVQSHAARAAWRNDGCPLEGPLFEEKKRLSRRVF